LVLLYCLVLALFPAAVPFALALVVQHIWGNWPKPPKLWLAALPLPMLFAIPSACLLMDVLLRPVQACQKGVCEIDQTVAIGGMIFAVIALVIGLATANLVLNKAQDCP
jgi:hypothetical protein